MELRDFATRKAKEPDLQTVAAQIRPLPDNVVPSEQFLEQMRLRLLKLAARDKRPAPKRAA